MLNSEYGDLGKEMKSMKNRRVEGMAAVRSDRRKRSTETQEILDQGRRIVAQAGDLLAQTGKANAQLQAQTRRALADARTQLNTTARQTDAMTSKTRTLVRQDVSAIKADAGRIVAGAGKFLADTHHANDMLRTTARQIVADAAATIGQFANASRQRASDWREIVRTVRGSGSSPSPSPASTTTTCRTGACKKASKTRTKARRG